MMNSLTIEFNTKGHDDFIDFIKAYAILCVLFGHTFGIALDFIAYGVWAGMQVPLFILIQTFHSYKKDNVSFSIGKVFKRVLLPFFLIESLTFLIALIGGRDCKLLISSMLIGGGYGPGSYYPWIYLQIALLLPLFYWMLNKVNRTTALIVFLVICESFEILFSLVGIPNWIYRLFAVRYIFLIYLGWIWVKDGVKINVITILLSIISLIAIIYFEYYKYWCIDDSPWFVHAGFAFHHWPCYFFVANAFIALLYKLWRKVNVNSKIVKAIKILAASSYEIFLLQMSLIYLTPKKLLVAFVGNKIASYVLFVVFIWTFSIMIGILWFKIRTRSAYGNRNLR